MRISEAFFALGVSLKSRAEFRPGSPTSRPMLTWQPTCC